MERFVVLSPLDKMLFNTVLVTCAYYFIYLEIGSGWYSNIYKLIIVKLVFDRSILNVRVFVNRLEHALNNLENPKHFSRKWVFIPFGKYYLFFSYSHKISNFIFNTAVRNFKAPGYSHFATLSKCWKGWLCWEAYVLRKAQSCYKMLKLFLMSK